VAPFLSKSALYTNVKKSDNQSLKKSFFFPVLDEAMEGVHQFTFKDLLSGLVKRSRHHLLVHGSPMSGMTRTILKMLSANHEMSVIIISGSDDDFAFYRASRPQITCHVAEDAIELAAIFTDILDFYEDEIVRPIIILENIIDRPIVESDESVQDTIVDFMNKIQTLGGLVIASSLISPSEKIAKLFDAWIVMSPRHCIVSTKRLLNQWTDDANLIASGLEFLQKLKVKSGPYSVFFERSINTFFLLA
jgi:hypothetical protein